jgi:hypothetical protein
LQQQGAPVAADDFQGLLVLRARIVYFNVHVFGLNALLGQGGEQALSGPVAHQDQRNAPGQDYGAKQGKPPGLVHDYLDNLLLTPHGQVKIVCIHASASPRPSP